MATGASMLAPGAVGIPTIPGLPIPMPTTVSMPQDLLCAGTGWSATDPAAGPDAAPHAPEARRGDW
jgi:hypothetical protein